MKLTLINQELSESRLYRATNSFSRISGEKVAALLYLNTLLTILLTKDRNQHEYGIQYAAKTAQYGPYTFFRSFATDLYILAFQVNAPNNLSSKMSTSDKEYLNRLSFNNRQHWNIMNKIGKESAKDYMLTSFFLSLERQLKITSSKYKNWRRQIINWTKLSHGQREVVSRTLFRELRVTQNRNDLNRKLGIMVSQDSFTGIDDKPSTTKKVIGTVVGAAVGRHIGGKYKKIGKNLGTVIGGAAGYWAGRKK